MKRREFTKFAGVGVAALAFLPTWIRQAFAAPAKREWKQYYAFDFYREHDILDVTPGLGDSLPSLGLHERPLTPGFIADVHRAHARPIFRAFNLYGYREISKISHGEPVFNEERQCWGVMSSAWMR